MIDDIFRATFHFEDPSGASSSSCYFQQTEDNLSTNRDTIELARALEAELDALIVAVLASTFWWTAIEVRKVWDAKEPVWLETSNPQAGAVVGPGLPSNCCVIMSLAQSTFGAKSNARMFWPGVPESKTNAGTLDATFQSTEWAALRNRMLLPFDSISDAGSYSLGMISQKVLNAAPPAKDWPGAFAFVTSASVNPILGIQRRRTTKVIGAVA